jgi:hypothetical protein
VPTLKSTLGCLNSLTVVSPGVQRRNFNLSFLMRANSHAQVGKKHNFSTCTAYYSLAICTRIVAPSNADLFPTPPRNLVLCESPSTRSQEVNWNRTKRELGRRRRGGGEGREGGLRGGGRRGLPRGKRGISWPGCDRLTCGPVARTQELAAPAVEDEAFQAVYGLRRGQQIRRNLG